MNAPDYESIWQQSLIRVTDKFSLPPILLRVDDATIGTLGNFSVSTGKAKAKKTFNVSALVASALAGHQVLEYRAYFPESKRNILYFDTEQSPYHCQLVMQRILRLAGLPLDREPERLKFSHLRAIADPNQDTVLKKCVSPVALNFEVRTKKQTKNNGAYTLFEDTI